MSLPTEEEIAAAKRKHQAADASTSIAGPGGLPSWKFTGGCRTYQIGGLSLRLRPLARRAARRMYDILMALPLMIQVAAQCGTDEFAERLDFERMATILSAIDQATVTPDLAAAAWRDFVSGDGFNSSIGLLADALHPLLDDPVAQGLAWPRPELSSLPETTTDDDVLKAWRTECEKIVADALPRGCRWLDDAIEEELHELEIPLLLTIIFDVQGGFPGDFRERFTHP